MARRNDILGSIIWDIEPGVLVKVKKQNFNGSIYYQYGIVIGNKQVDQLEMFPFVEVYTFETQTVSKQQPYTLEIISRHSNEKNKKNLD